MSLQRNQHWATRHFHQFLLDSVAKPFQWGAHDCCLFAADGIQAITGVDIADDFRGKYSDQASAFALIKQLTGGTTVADAAAYCASKHGLTELTHPLLAQRGDLVVLENEGRLIAGLVHLNGRQVVTVTEEQLWCLPITDVKRAWRV